MKYARNISSNEALRLISDVRMGISMGIIKEVTIDKIDVLLNLIQPAMIQDYFGRK